MNSTDQIENTQTQKKSDPAFEVLYIDLESGKTTITIQKGIMGATANQLKNTSPQRKGSTILRKLGHVLAECGDVQYGKDVSETTLNPCIISK